MRQAAAVMIAPGVGQNVDLLVIFMLLVRPLGASMPRVFTGNLTPFDPVLRSVEHAIMVGGR